MKVAITSGKAEGPSKLNAFDNALLDAGIGDVNLIKVSSILPKNTLSIKTITPRVFLCLRLRYSDRLP